MIPINFEQANIKVAENQDEYMTLPAHHDPEEGTLISCWQLTPEEIEQIQKTGVIWFRQVTFNRKMQPVLITTENPFE